MFSWGNMPSAVLTPFLRLSLLEKGGAAGGAHLTSPKVKVHSGPLLCLVTGGHSVLQT